LGPLISGLALFALAVVDPTAAREQAAKGASTFAKTPSLPGSTDSWTLLLPLVAVLAVFVARLVGVKFWRWLRPADPRSVDMLVDPLVRAVRGQLRKEAAERLLVTPAPIPVRWILSDLPVVGPVEEAVGEPHAAPAFPPLPGQVRIDEDQLRVGGGRGELFSVYAGIASGRMLVLGEPGAGKTGSALLLALDALDRRDRVEDEERVKVPVPVLLTPHGWDPTTCSAQDWLAARLAATYPLFQPRSGEVEAAALIAAGAVALILDEFGEMDGAQRPAALQALSEAPFRVVVLARSQEMIEAAASAWLVGAVALELQPVTGPEAADYLQRARTGPPPLGWPRLLTRLRRDPDGVLTGGWSTPLALTLMRDTYRAGDDVGELLNGAWGGICTDVEQRLFGRVLLNAYTPRPGRPKPRYTVGQAKQTLAFLAQRMTRDQTRDLGWWHIPQWISTTPRVLASMLAGGILGALLSVILVGLIYGSSAWPNGLTRSFWTSLGYPLVAGFGVGLALGFGGGHGSGKPKQISARYAFTRRSALTAWLTYALATWLGVLLVSLVVGVVYDYVGIPNVLSRGVVGFVVGLPLGLQRKLVGGIGDGQGNLRGPVESRRTGRAAGFVVALLVGTAAGVVFGRMPDVGIAGVAFFGVAVGLPVWLAVWFMVGLVPRLVGRFVTGPADDKGSALGPLESWRNDQMFSLVAGIPLGLAATLGVGLGFARIAGGGTFDVVNGLAYGLTVGLMYAITSSGRWSTMLTWRLLRRRSRRVPAVNLMSFLEDARHRHVLRAVGAVYQFRHAALQYQLARQSAKVKEPQSSFTER
jgi:hypothetical protein